MTARREMRHDPQGGFILVAVLGVMALLAGLIGTTSLLVRSSVDAARIAGDDLQAAALARAGVELAGYQLYGLKLPPEGIDAQQVRFDAGTVTLFVTDEGGKIDLNASLPDLLAGAYRAAGLNALAPDTFAARVVDWRDEDAKPLDGGAEGPAYVSERLAHRPQNDAFRSVDDLRWLLGISVEQVPALAKVLTVHNPDGKVNIMSASREVLLSLPGITPATVDRLLVMRRGGIGGRASEFTALLQKQKEFIKLDPGPAFRVRVEARLSRGRQTSVEAVLIPSRSDDALYFVVAWLE